MAHAYKSSIIRHNRTRNPDRYRTIILTVIEMFSNLGYDNARIDDIALKAGIGKGTIYNYFSSKTDLFEETIKFILKDQIKYIKHAVQSVSSIEEKIITYIVSGMKTAIDAGIPPQGVPLSYNSCSRWTGDELITTDVYLKKIDEILTF